MKSKFLLLLLTFFTITIVSLMSVLFVQNRKVDAISDDLISNNITAAMDNVLQHLVRMNLEELVSEQSRYTMVTYRRIDDLNNKIISLLDEQQNFFFDIQRIRLNISVRDSAIARDPALLTPTEQSYLTQYNTLVAVRNRLIDEYEAELPDKNQSNIPNENIFAANDFNFQRLESIINEELIVNGIQEQPQIGLYDITNDELLHSSPDADEAELISSPYKYSFRLSQVPSSHEYCILLKFPFGFRLLYNTNIISLIISIFLILIIILLFNMAIKTIFHMKNLDEMKNSFINNMTHEIKTPIATIGLACEMLNDPSVESDEATRRSFLNAITEETRRMRILVETILQNSKMSNPNFALNLKPVSLNEVAADTVRSFRLAMTQRNGTIEEDYDPDLPTINADIVHISNMVHNLIDNAIKYSEGQPYIKVSTRKAAGKVLLTIEDHGIGIDKEDQKHIFEKFYRVSTGDVHNIKGFGIGLNYVANVVQQHHGAIALESEPAKGSKFTITIPLETPLKH